MISNTINIKAGFLVSQSRFATKIYQRQFHTFSIVSEIANNALQKQSKSIGQALVKKEDMDKNNNNKEVLGIGKIILSNPNKSNKMHILSLEEYKKKHLLTYEEYKQRLISRVLKYSNHPEEINDDNKIKETYEMYCMSSYNGYKLELQDLPDHFSIL